MYILFKKSDITLTASEGLTVKAGSGSPLLAGPSAPERMLLPSWFIGPQWLTFLVDSGGQHSIVEAALNSGATSAAHLQSLALSQGLSIAHLLAGTGWLVVTLLIAGLGRSARHGTFARVQQAPKVWRWSQCSAPPPYFLPSHPPSRLSPTTPYSF